jgi:ribonuclease P protein component
LHKPHDLSVARHTLSKAERLKSYKRIRLLFAEGQKFKLVPLLVYYQFRELVVHSSETIPIQMGVSVGSRYFKKAVDRNLIKRRIREAYRKNNADLKQEVMDKAIGVDVFFVYTSTELLSYSQFEASMLKAIQILLEKISKSQQSNTDN